MLRRPPPLGLRADANQSTTSLPSHYPPPSRHGPPGLPYARTHSAASIASWGTPRRERLDSFSSRTSSLTSIVNMYQRIPPTYRTVQSGLSAPIPRYYDYTEDFEYRQPRTITPIQPFAPVPTRAPSFQRPLVLQESDDHLEVAFRERDSAFYESESQNADETEITPLTRGSTPRFENYRAPSRCRTGSIRSENTSIVLDGSETGSRLMRGSDVDLLPSQAGRESVDTFNPSLDLESKDAPTYRYTDYRTTVTPKTKANSPEKHVQVQRGRTPTVHSEQGVIMRDDTRDETLQDTSKNDEEHLIEGQPMVGQEDDVLNRRSCSEPAQDILAKSIHHEALLHNQHAFATMNHGASRHNEAGVLRDRTSTVTLTTAHGPGHSIGDGEMSRTENLDKNCSDAEEGDLMPISMNQVTPRHRFQRHKRNQAIPRISTSSLPKEDNESFRYISPSCSTTPIVSPKPISPARQLKLKNSVPQLMKALPPVPGDPDYVPSPTLSMRSLSSNEGDFAEVLTPFRFSQPSISQMFKAVDARNHEVPLNDDRLPSLQKNVPKLKLRKRMSNSSGATFSSDTRLCDKTTDRRCSTESPDTRLDSKGGELHTKVPTRNRLKLRSSRSTTISTTPPVAVHRNADTKGSDLTTDIAHQKPQESSNFPVSVGSPLHRVSRNPSQSIQDDRSAVGRPFEAVAHTVAPSQRERRRIPANAYRQNKFPYKAKSMEALRSTEHHGLRRHFSNLRSLLARPYSPAPVTSVADGTHGEKENKVPQDANPTNANLNNKIPTVNGERLHEGHNHRTTFGRRVRSRVVKWIKDAKTAVRVCSKKTHGD